MMWNCSCYVNASQIFRCVFCTVYKFCRGCSGLWVVLSISIPASYHNARQYNILQKKACHANEVIQYNFAAYSAKQALEQLAWTTSWARSINLHMLAARTSANMTTRIYSSCCTCLKCFLSVSSEKVFEGAKGFTRSINSDISPILVDKEPRETQANPVASHTCTPILLSHTWMSDI